jgi:hypothetical protein
MKRLGMGAIAVLLAATACKPVSFSTPAQEAAGTARGFRDNPLRKAAGLREIRPGWKCFRSINGKDEWLADPRSEAADKTVIYDSATPRREIEQWISGRKFFADGQTIEEGLVLEYDYTSKRFLFSYLGDDPLLEPLNRGTLSTADALKLVDTALAKWGKSRL